MAFVLANRVKETTTTSGTGTVTLLGASTGFQSFAIIGNANTTYYTIAGQLNSEWEVGIGTYTSSGTTLARTTVLANSSATQPSALSFAAGTKDVFVTQPAEVTVVSSNNYGTSGQLLTSGGTGVAPTWTTVAAAAALSNDTTTATNLYPIFAAATTGTPTTIYTGNTKLLYKPSTGEFQSSVLTASNGFFTNINTIAADYTVAATVNGGSFGPVTINSGITVTVTSGAVWTVV